MKTIYLILSLLLISGSLFSQGPEITKWMINTTGLKARHYVSGNPTAFIDPDSANVLQVYYSANWVYVRTTGMPGYVTGPFLDGNPSVASNQNAIFKISRFPAQNTSTSTSTTPGNIGIFINGVALFDYRDGASWKSSTGTIAGGPAGGMGDGVWNRDAVVAERLGFDCIKGHPAMGNYHHHQNPSAYKLDLNVISTICNMYDADGLYVIDSSQHSPLIGYAYDGFPIYGAYAWQNTNGTGPVVRMKSSYSLRNISVRNTYANGNSVTAGPNVSTNYPLGYFREDYEFISSSDPDRLDEHNGRFCFTPEYPAGTYAYFCTVDSNWNSAYPYAVGPTFYGIKNTVKVTSITEPVTQYIPSSTGMESFDLNENRLLVFPNPASDLIAIQISPVNYSNVTVQLIDLNGKLLQTSSIPQGSTLTFFDLQTFHEGEYIFKIISADEVISKLFTVRH